MFMGDGFVSSVYNLFGNSLGQDQNRTEIM